MYNYMYINCIYINILIAINYLQIQINFIVILNTRNILYWVRKVRADVEGKLKRRKFKF